MKLYTSGASPFGRKVRVLIREAGLAEKVEEVMTLVSPVKSNPELGRANPLMKVPTLVTDDGFALFDSPVICEYLDSLNAGRKLFPSGGPARWTALRQQAVADGVLDAAILVRYQSTLCPPELHWTAWLDSQRAKWQQGLEFLEQEAKSLAAEATIGTVAIGVTLAWLDYRYGDVDWRPGCPLLAGWFESFNARPSMQATLPEG